MTEKLHGAQSLRS